MKSAALVSFALVFAASAVSAQIAERQPPQVTIIHVPPINNLCPVSLRVQHGVSGDMLKVDKTRPKGVAQLLHLTLTNPDSKQIVAAKVRVHGLSGKGHTAQTPVGQDYFDVSKTLHLNFPDEAGKEVSSDLWAPDMTAVLSVDLDSVTFADGTTQNFSRQNACRVAPDPKMLIGGR